MRILLGVLLLLCSLLRAQVSIAQCANGYEVACFLESNPPLVASGDIVAIQSNPAAIASIYPIYKNALRADLGAGFAGITDKGLAFAFATLVAYQARPYVGLMPACCSSQPPTVTLSDLLSNQYGLACAKYVSLAIQLFYLIESPSSLPNAQITLVGWRQDSAVGNHAQILAAGSDFGIPLLLDPTYGNIATVTLYNLISGVQLTGGQLAPNIGIRNDILQNNQRPKVRNAIANGSYRSTDLIYAFSTTYQAGTQPRSAAINSDILELIAPGPSNTFYFLTTEQRLWQISGGGLALADSGTYYQSIAGRYADGAITQILTETSQFATGSPGNLYQITATGTQLNTPGATALVGGLGGNAIYFLTGDYRMFQITSAGPALVTPGITMIAAGDAASVGGAPQAVYYLTSSGVLDKLDQTHGAGIVDTGVGAIYSGWGKHSGGQVFLLKTNGDLTLIDQVLSGSEILLESNVAGVVLGFDGATVTTLLTNGTVTQAQLYCLYPGAPVPCTTVSFSPAIWLDSGPTGGFTSIDLSFAGSAFGSWVTATTANGSTNRTIAAHY